MCEIDRVIVSTPVLVPLTRILIDMRVTLAQIQYSDKSAIFVFPETPDEFSRSHVI